MNYRFNDGDNVRIVAVHKTGYVSSRVPGNGTGTGWYYVRTEDGETGPYSEGELEDTQ